MNLLGKKRTRMLSLVILSSDKVSLIIDHHPENPTNVLSCEKNIQLVGSCASLVADYAVKAAVYLPDDARELIASAIVIDTSGFSPIQLFRFIQAFLILVIFLW